MLTLAVLAKRHAVRAVVTQPDRPAGRGGEMTPTPVAAFAAGGLAGVPVLKPEKVNDPAVVARVREYPADAWVVIAFGQKLGMALREGRDRKSTRLNSSHIQKSRMPSSA